MTNMKITDEFIQTLGPCRESFMIYLDYYKGKTFTLLEFLNLRHMNVSDKLWLFVQPIPRLKKLQREFACICAARIVEKTNIKALKELFTLNLLIIESGDYNLIQSLDYSSIHGPASRSSRLTVGHSRAFRAACIITHSYPDTAADFASSYAAYNAAKSKSTYYIDFFEEKEIQLKIAKNLVSEEEL